MPDRPNILFITADQHRADALGSEGRAVKTPHLDRLRAAGAHFGACMTPNPVCQPSRASMLTGLMPLTHGVWDNGVDLAEGVAAEGFAARLSTAGYRTGLLGKAHFSTYRTFAPTGRPECWQSCADYAPDWHGPYMGFDHVELAVEPHNVEAPLAPPRGLHYENWLYAQAPAEEIASLTQAPLAPLSDAAQTRHSGLPSAWHNTTWTADRTIDYIRNCGNEPFFAWASFADPHHPFDCPEPWSRLHAPASVDLPRHHQRDLDQRPWWHRAALETVPQIDNPALLAYRQRTSRTSEQTEEQLRDLIANYYGMISLIDHNVGRITAELRRLGKLDNTYIVYSSDHGDWLGDHGLLLKGPMTYEGLLRVPLLMTGPTIAPGTSISSPVSSMDLAATFLDWTGVGGHEDMHARPLQPVIDGQEERRFTLTEWDLSASRCGVPLRLRTIRTKRYKLTVELDSGSAEMYDLTDDPDEMFNVAESPGYTTIRKGLEKMLDERPDDMRKSFDRQVGMA